MNRSVLKWVFLYTSAFQMNRPRWTFRNDFQRETTGNSPAPWKRPERFLLMLNQWSSSERISWCYPLADALLSRSALLMNSLGLVSACAGLDYEWTQKSSRAETRFMHYSVLIIFHAPIRTAFTCAFTRSSFTPGLSPSSNCGGKSAVVQIIAALAIYLSFVRIRCVSKPSHFFFS